MEVVEAVSGEAVEVAVAVGLVVADLQEEALQALDQEEQEVAKDSSGVELITTQEWLSSQLLVAIKEFHAQPQAHVLVTLKDTELNVQVDLLYMVDAERHKNVQSPVGGMFLISLPSFWLSYSFAYSNEEKKDEALYLKKRTYKNIQERHI